MTEEINKKKTFLFEFQKVQCISFMIRVDNWLSPVLARVAMPVVPEVPVLTVSPRFYLDIYLRSSSTFFTIRSKENLNYFWSLCVLMYGSILSTFCDILNFDEEVQCPQVTLKGELSAQNILYIILLYKNQLTQPSPTSSASAHRMLRILFAGIMALRWTFLRPNS